MWPCTLDDNVDSRYLKSATDVVNFTYSRRCAKTTSSTLPMQHHRHL